MVKSYLRGVMDKMKNRKIIIALVALLSTSTILVACVVGYKAFQFLQDNKIEMSMDSEVEPAKENVVEEREDQAETVPVEETKQLEDVENVARGDATGKAVEIEKPADKKEENIAKENKDKVKKSGIYLDKSGITKNSDGSYSFSDEYIADVKKIQGMDKFNEQEINEILNETGEYLVVISDESAEIFIKDTMKEHTPSGLSESNNGQLKVDTSKSEEQATITPETPVGSYTSSQHAEPVDDGEETCDDWVNQNYERNKNLTSEDVLVGGGDASKRMDWSRN